MKQKVDGTKKKTYVIAKYKKEVENYLENKFQKRKTPKIEQIKISEDNEQDEALEILENLIKECSKCKIERDEYKKKYEEIQGKYNIALCDINIYQDIIKQLQDSINDLQEENKTLKDKTHSKSNSIIDKLLSLRG